jgi:hypothetical protein
MRQAAACLQAGGILYQEIRRFSAVSLFAPLPSLRERCHQAGLTLAGLYWAAPNFENCRRYIPLDAPGALHWYFSSLFVAGTPLNQSLRRLFQLPLIDQRKLLSWFAPTLCLTAIAGDEIERPPAILEHPCVVDALPKEDLRPIVLTSGQDDASRVILLPFGRQKGNAPYAVIKVATDAKFNRETENEQLILNEVRAKVDSQLGKGIPQALQRFYYCGLAGGIESCAPGHSLWVSSGEWGASADARVSDMESGVDWLCEFHRQTQRMRLTWDRQAIQRWIEQPVARYTEIRGISHAEQRLFSTMKEYAQGLIGAEVPLVWQHNDFAPWNLFRDGDHLTVIDWEFNRNWEQTQAGPPLCDLLYFLTYWNNVSQRIASDEAELAGLYDLFLAPMSENRYQQAARQAVARYLAALQIDGRFVPLWLVYTWMERVIYSHSRMQKLGKRASVSRAADKFAGFVGLLAGHVDKLFAAGTDSFWAGQDLDQKPDEGATRGAQLPAVEALP